MKITEMKYSFLVIIPFLLTGCFNSSDENSIPTQSLDIGITRIREENINKDLHCAGLTQIVKSTVNGRIQSEGTLVFIKSSAQSIHAAGDLRVQDGFLTDVIVDGKLDMGFSEILNDVHATGETVLHDVIVKNNAIIKGSLTSGDSTYKNLVFEEGDKNTNPSKELLLMRVTVTDTLTLKKCKEATIERCILNNVEVQGAQTKMLLIDTVIEGSLTGLNKDQLVLRGTSKVKN